MVVSDVALPIALGTATVVSMPAWRKIGKSWASNPLSTDCWPSRAPDTKKVKFLLIGPLKLPVTRLKPTV